MYNRTVDQEKQDLNRTLFLFALLLGIVWTLHFCYFDDVNLLQDKPQLQLIFVPQESIEEL